MHKKTGEKAPCVAFWVDQRVSPKFTVFKLHDNLITNSKELTNNLVCIIVSDLIAYLKMTHKDVEMLHFIFANM